MKTLLKVVGCNRDEKTIERLIALYRIGAFIGVKTIQIDSTKSNSFDKDNIVHVEWGTYDMYSNR
jgi:hypothetical protein